MTDNANVPPLCILYRADYDQCGNQLRVKDYTETTLARLDCIRCDDETGTRLITPFHKRVTIAYSLQKSLPPYILSLKALKHPQVRFMSLFRFASASHTAAGQCIVERQTAESFNDPNVYIPDCESDGSYKELQCNNVKTL